jgi:hypothetical protein
MDACWILTTFSITFVEDVSVDRKADCYLFVFRRLVATQDDGYNVAFCDATDQLKRI